MERQMEEGKKWRKVAEQVRGTWSSWHFQRINKVLARSRRIRARIVGISAQPPARCLSQVIPCPDQPPGSSFNRRRSTRRACGASGEADNSHKGWSMSDLWKRCEGQVVDGQFPLLQFLANTNHSAVFLSKAAGGEPGRAVLKFISAEIPAPEERLGTWKTIGQLEHAHLLRILHSGRCRMAGLELLYVVMERADEELARFLPQRALSAEEARDLLSPLVEALGYLHGEGFAHGHVKPSNICAIDEEMKLSSDTIVALGQESESHRDLDVYDAPENSATANITASSAGDVWSLGITLVEALTQQAPALPFDDAAEMAIPETIPAPFLEIARHCLVRDPARRWSMAEISACLNPVPLAAAASAGAGAATGSIAAASISPMSATVSTGATGAAARLPRIAERGDLREAKALTEKIVTLPSYVIPVMLFSALVLIVVLTFPKFFRHLSASPGGAAASSSVAANTKGLPTVTGKATAAGAAPRPAMEVKKSADAALYAKAVTKTAASSNERGDVLEKVLPQASPKALATIHGTVRVVVKVNVDAAGNVSKAELESQGPSKYFAELALKAAREWEFASPVSNGHSLGSEWAIRFEFSPNGAVAFPTQQLP